MREYMLWGIFLLALRKKTEDEMIGWINVNTPLTTCVTPIPTNYFLNIVFAFISVFKPFLQLLLTRLMQLVQQWLYN